MSAPGDRLYALVPCAGTGARAGTQQPKQYQQVAGQALVMHTLQALAAVSRLKARLVVLAPGDQYLQPRADVWDVAHCGGKTRAETVLNGLQALQARGARRSDWVLVHDAARCLVQPEQVDTLIDACLADGVGGLLGLPLPDTLKREAGQRVLETLDRDGLWLAQTPQMFRIGALQEALEAHVSSDFAGITDEASAMEAAGVRPLLVRGSAHNIKVTYPEDFALAEAVLKGRVA